MSTFIITGGSRGLGKGIARSALGMGFDVALIARNATALEAARVTLINEFPMRNISLHKADLSEEDQCQIAFDDIFTQHLSIRCLVNNAATWTGGKSVVNLTTLDMRQSLDLNFMSAFLATKHVLHNRKSQEDLSIVNIGATAALRGSANNAAFCVAKSSLRIFSQSLAREVGNLGIHIAHLIIDGLISNERTIKLNPGRSESRYISVDSIAKEVLHVALQNRDSWTFEWEVRTNNADW